MALDFAQIEDNGNVTGLTVRLTPSTHASIMHQLTEDEFPLLYRMREYYDDAEYEIRELALLKLELARYLEKDLPNESTTVVQSMLNLVQDSIEKGLRIEAIAD